MNCPACGHPLEASARQCRYCGRSIEAPADPHPAEPAPNPFGDVEVFQATMVPSGPRLEDNAAVRMIVPLGQSPLAIIAGYVGLISLFVCFLGPVAIVIGALAIRQIRKHPHMHGTYRAIIGIVLGLISSVGLIAVIASLLFAG